MRTANFQELVLNSQQRLAFPLATYPGLALTGAKVWDIVTNPGAQYDAQAALRQRFSSSFALSAMDLSVEAEAFGCDVTMSATEIPTVTGRRVTSFEQAKALTIPQPGDCRTRVYLEAVRLLGRLPGEPFVFGGCIGPFSLAARLVGVSETMALTLTEPVLIHTVLEKSAVFLLNYIKAFKAAGARGVIMAEPAAGLLSPGGMRSFSSVYIRQISAELSDSSFILLHNCAARLPHLAAIQETGLSAFHFGAPMDLPAALAKVPPDIVLSGNLDPVAVFVQLPPAEVTTRVAQLLASTAKHRNFVVSSGCDIPPNTPLASLDAFYQCVAQNPPTPPN